MIGVIERLEGLIESLLAATVLLVVGLCGNVAKQLFEVFIPGGQHDALSLIGEARSKDEALARGVDEEQASKRSGTSAGITTLTDGTETSSGRRGRRSNTDPSHPRMTPSSPQSEHRHSIDGGTSVRNRA